MGRNQYGRNNFRVTVGQTGGRKTFYQHDNRDNEEGYHGGPSAQRGHGTNRVWRKGDKHVQFNENRHLGVSTGGPRGRGIRKKFRGTDRSLATRLGPIAEDDTTHRHPNAGRARPLPGTTRGSRGRGRGMTRRDLSSLVSYKGRPSDGDGWNKVKLLNASRHDKTEVLRALVNSFKELQPLSFHKQGMNYVFYVETRSQANTLNGLDQKVVLSDGTSTLNISAEPSAPPQTNVDEEMIEKIKVAMSDRYIAENKALNLKAFHADPKFLGESCYVPLHRSPVMKKVVEIVGSNIPILEAIDLSENRLHGLDGVVSLLQKAPNTKILYLAKNKLQLHDIEALRPFKIKELVLEGNPMIQKTMNTDESKYISYVRKIIPSLQKLDGKELPKIIGFEGEDEETTSVSLLPTVHMKMENCQPEAEKIILQFLQEYFKVYDTANRENIMNAYHDDAVMSMHMAYPEWCGNVQGAEKLNEYMARSRNLMRVADPTKRNTYLRKGKLAICAFLAELPKSEHDVTSFTLDIPFATERLMSFTVSGIFREPENQGGTAGQIIRHFNRVFVVVPHGQGFCIVNDMLYVTIPTHRQKKNWGLPQVDSANTVQGVTDSQLDAVTKHSLITNLSQATGMNEEFSKICLTENGWDLNKATEAFHNAQREGKIPLNAFEK